MTTHTPLSLLLVEDDRDLCEILTQTLTEAGHTVRAATDGRQALDAALSQPVDVVLSDVRIPSIDGFTLFRRLREANSPSDVILMTAHADVTQAIAALKEGAYDYLIKPFDTDELLVQLGRIASQRRLKHELEQARAELKARPSQGVAVVGHSPEILRVLGMVGTVAQSDAATLVTGESGTGKELIARMLHEQSSRRDGPFVIVNCGALSEHLIEAELFGHERGAFTGAEKKRDGRFKFADGGTIFLDEIAELPAPAQAKLLRVLQEGTFEPIGSNASVKVDVRVISATHRDLRERISHGLFREDLYYRINVIEITLPPLRDRRGDLPLLTQFFLERFTPAGQQPPTITESAWAALEHYSYPGNVRELSHAIQHAVVLSGRQGTIDVNHLPATISTALPSTKPAVAEGMTPGQLPTAVQSLSEAVRAFERDYLLRVVAQSGGKKTQAAEALGISRKTLWEKLKGYGVGEVETPS